MFECKAEEKECMRLLLMENSGKSVMEVHVSIRCTWSIVVISFKSYWFWVMMIPWWSADYLCWVYYCTWNYCAHVPRTCRDLINALLLCPVGCNSSGHDLLASGAAAEEVGILQQPRRSKKGQPDFPHTEWLFQRSCCQRQPWYVGNLSENRRHGSLQYQFISTRCCTGIENSLKRAFFTSVYQVTLCELCICYNY